MNRTLNVVRMQLVNRQTYVWVPLIILGGALIISLAIYGIARSGGASDQIIISGGAQAPLWYFAVVGVQALTLTFPFSQAMSVTRREFYLGTLLTAMLTAALLSIIFVLGGLLEKATGGWWINGHFFHLDWIWEAGPLAAGVFYFAIALVFFVVGFWAATIYKRFGTMWLTIVLLGVTVLLVAAIWLITRLQAWPDVVGWFVTQGALGLALWGLLMTAVLAVISYLTLRRAVP